jgi:hypothetical protein
MNTANAIATNSDQIGVRLPRPILKAYKELAKREGRTISELTRRLIADELRRNGKQITITINLL